MLKFVITEWKKLFKTMIGQRTRTSHINFNTRKIHKYIIDFAPALLF